jgi:hypothetical protein
MAQVPSWRQVREARLRADRERLRTLAGSSDLIAVEELEGDPPEAYRVTFSCRGVVAPGLTRPVLSESHRVLITLPVEYPTRGPQLRWLTEIFHPNVNPEGTLVCVDAWYPGRLLDDLCVMLGRMIQYKNYNPLNCLRPEAALWALRHRALLPVDERPLRRGAEGELPGHDFEVRIVRGDGPGAG